MLFLLASRPRSFQSLCTSMVVNGEYVGVVNPEHVNPVISETEAVWYLVLQIAVFPLETEGRCSDSTTMSDLLSV